MSEQTQTPVPVVTVNKAGCLTQIATILTIIVALGAIVFGLLPLAGVHVVVGPLEPVAPTVRVLPTAASLTPQPVYVAPTAPMVLPTALPVGQPIAPVLEALPSAPDAPPVLAPTVRVPPEIRTRGAVCFGGWWYLDGERTAKSCSGTGGD